MPLVAHNDLPSFARLRAEGFNILPADRALHQDIREMHIGLLNMMPDKALEATERQFLRLIGGANQIAQFHVHPFTLDELPRGEKARAHVGRYYDTFAKLRHEGLDALIVTGANVTHAHLEREPFWEPLIEVVDWGAAHVPSVLCSCLATHAVMQFRYGKRRRSIGFKRWGVFPHRVIDRSHPLVADANTVFDVPHSRFNDISHAEFAGAGLHVLVESAEAGVHLAVSEDGFRIVMFQGHPEYDTISLMKEYKRDLGLYAQGRIPHCPPCPENYFGAREQALLDEYRERLVSAHAAGSPLPEFPEDLVAARLDNTWHDTAEAIVGNWIGAVYQVTNPDRKKLFMEGVDPADPLGWRASRAARG